MRTKAIFHMPKLNEEVTHLVKECEICIQAKGEHDPYPGLLQPWRHLNKHELLFLWILYRGCQRQNGAQSF